MRVCEGLPVHARLGVGSTKLPGPHGLRFSFGDSIRLALSVVRGALVARRSTSRSGALRLASVRFSDSSHGVVKVPPLHRHGRLVSTPVVSAAPKSCHLASSRGILPGDAEPTSARGCHVPDSFRPCRSSRLRRFAPPGTLQVCCTLLPIMGFAMFPVVRVVSRRLTVPPARAGEGRGFRSLSGRTPRGASFLRAFTDLAARLARPRRALLTLATRLALVSLGPFPMALHPSELFPRQQLCCVNRAFQPHSRPSAILGRTRFWCRVWSVVRPYGSGHRSRCLLAVVRGLVLPRSDPAQAQRVRVAGFHRSLDLKAFVR